MALDKVETLVSSFGGRVALADHPGAAPTIRTTREGKAAEGTGAQRRLGLDGAHRLSDGERQGC